MPDAQRARVAGVTPSQVADKRMLTRYMGTGKNDICQNPPGVDQNQTRSAAIPRIGLKNSQGCGSRLLRRMRARKYIRLEITEEQFQGFVPQPIDRVHISVFK